MRRQACGGLLRRASLLRLDSTDNSQGNQMIADLPKQLQSAWRRAVKDVCCCILTPRRVRQICRNMQGPVSCIALALTCTCLGGTGT